MTKHKTTEKPEHPKFTPVTQDPREPGDSSPVPSETILENVQIREGGAGEEVSLDHPYPDHERALCQAMVMDFARRHGAADSLGYDPSVYHPESTYRLWYEAECKKWEP